MPKVKLGSAPGAPNISRARHYVLLAVIAAASLALMVRIGYLTEVEQDFLLDQGEQRSLRSVAIPAHRGIIYDRNGTPLAVSAPMTTLWFDPQKATIGDDGIVRMAEILRLPVEIMRARFSPPPGRRFAYIARHVDPADAESVLRLGFDGIESHTEYRRFYPAGETTAHVIGLTDIDDVGIGGVELVSDATLARTPGKKLVEHDLKGQVVKVIDYVSPPKHGDDVMLALDLRLQYFAHRELKSAVRHYRAKSGSLVMLDVQTGEILALVNQPSFNPNDRKDRGGRGIRNRAIIDTYEPGSTVKPFTMLAALESGQYDRDAVVDTSPGYFRVGRKLVEDPSNRGMMTLRDIIARSSQVGTSKIALSLASRAVFDAFVRAGLGEWPGTGLPGETSGLLTDRDLDKPVGRATLAYGYGLTVTPMQLAQAYLTLATGGLRRDISIYRGNGLGRGGREENGAGGRRVFEQRHVRRVVDMLEGVVVDEHGTAPKARIPGHRVAGKTGTARKVSNGAYDDESHVAFFAGFAPATHPRVVAVVVINEPKGDSRGGGEVCAPVFSRVVGHALRVLGITPRGGGAA